MLDILFLFVYNKLIKKYKSFVHSVEVVWMKIANIERLFIVITSFALNKRLLFWLIGSKSFFVLTISFILLALNFMILANTLDKLINTHEQLKKNKKINLV